MTIDRRAHLTDRALYKAFYDKDSRPGFIDLPVIDEPRLLWAMEAINPGDDVIDIGCHKGELTYGAWAKTEGRVVGLDISPNAIAHAITFANHRGMAIEWQVGEAEHLPYPDDSFDVAILTEILEHVPDPNICLAEAERVVREGGTIVVSTPGNAQAIDRYEAPTRDRLTTFALDMHVREYDPAVELAEKTDLHCRRVEVPSATPDGPIPAFVFLLARYTVRKAATKC